MDVVFVIVRVTNDVIPKPALPYSGVGGNVVHFFVPVGEPEFDGLDDLGDGVEIRREAGCFGDFDDDVKMIVQNHVRDHEKRFFPFDLAYNRKEQTLVGIGFEKRCAFFTNGGDKNRSVMGVVSSNVGHVNYPLMCRICTRTRRSGCDAFFTISNDPFNSNLCPIVFFPQPAKRVVP